MTDALGPEQTHRIPNTFRSAAFACMNGDSPPCVAAAFEMLYEKFWRKIRLVTGKIQGNDSLPLG